MSLLSSLFGKPLYLEHKFFGSIRFHKTKGVISLSYFSGQRSFAPLEKDLSFIINADETGPTQEQVNFFTILENKYDVVCHAVQPIIEEGISQQKIALKITDFKKEFELSSIQIPTLEIKPLVWQLSFVHSQNSKLVFDVAMKDFMPTHVITE